METVGKRAGAVRLFAAAALLVLLFSVNCFAGGIGARNCVKKAKKAVILVGDSRVMHMALSASSASRKNFYFVYANGKGILDLANNVGGFRTNLTKAMKKYPNATVVFMLGVNYNYEATENKRLNVYDSFIKSKTWKKHRFVVSTVGKTVGCRGSYSNSRVKSFNRKIASRYAGRKDVRIYDLYAFLDGKVLSKKDTRNGDGLHYKKDMYTKILKDLRKFTG